jgi:hypothetical protein
MGGHRLGRENLDSEVFRISSARIRSSHFSYYGLVPGGPQAWMIAPSDQTISSLAID